jgi:hypothetical protein
MGLSHISVAATVALFFAVTGSAVAQEPRQGDTVRVIAAEGVSYVRAPGGDAKRLTGKRIIPTGWSVDARRGTVTVQYACDGCTAGERIRSGTFSGGTFKVGQRHRRSRPTLTMNGPLERCAGVSHADGTSTLARHLVGRVGHAKFKVVGRYASVRTQRARWLIADYCARTFVAAAWGTLSVNDRQRQRSIAVGPQSAISILPRPSEGEAIGGGCCPSSAPYAELTQGTAVAMGDGTSVPAENLQAGDVIRTLTGGTAAIIFTTSQRVRTMRVLFIQTEAGRGLTVTPSSAVYTPDGEVPADELEPGDNLLTEDGPDRVASITIESYSGTVSALALEGAGEFFVASGLVVGSMTG